ncbi:hypothetical protein LPJ73_007148 [Coemansia sp. RSA 2703]|nr:hypothetical protein LPJ73_007148 [Coemansia sp. RSA 2703]
MEEESRKRKERLAKMRQSRDSSDTVEESVSGVVEEIVAKHQREAEQQQEIGIEAIAPKRADWDLKRDLQRRLDALQPQNEAAVTQLIRRRLQENDAKMETT